MWDPYAEVETVVLSNGLTIYCSYWPGRAFEIIECIVHSGSDQDPERKEGLAHFVEHVATQNGAEPFSETEKFFCSYGNRVCFGETGLLATKYGFCLPTDSNILAEALCRFGHMLLGAKLIKKIKAQRLIVLAEFRRKFPTKKRWEDFVEDRGLETRDGNLGKMIYNLGTESSIQSITSSDLQEFYEAHYTPENMSIVCSGGVSLNELINLIENSPFSKQITGTRTSTRSVIVDVGEYESRRKIVNISKQNTGEKRKTCRFETRALIPGIFLKEAIVQFKVLLAKRLLDELRESLKLVYHVNVFLSSMYGTFFELKIICEGIEITAIDQFEKKVDHVISTLSNYEDIFQQQRQAEFFGRMYFDPTIGGTADYLISDLVMLQRFVTLKEKREASDVITFQDVLAVVSMITPEKRWTKITRP